MGLSFLSGHNERQLVFWDSLFLPYLPQPRTHSPLSQFDYHHPLVHFCPEPWVLNTPGAYLKCYMTQGSQRDSGYTWKGLKISVSDICNAMFSVALFTVARNGIHLSIYHVQIKETQYIDTVDHDSAWTGEVLSFAGAWKSLEDSNRGKSSIERQILHGLTHMWEGKMGTGYGRKILIGLKL